MKVSIFDVHGRTHEFPNAYAILSSDGIALKVRSANTDNLIAMFNWNNIIGYSNG